MLILRLEKSSFLFYNLCGGYMQRYFVSSKEENIFYPSKEDLHHIYHVMRMKEGDLVEVVYEENLYLGKIKDNGIVLEEKIHAENKTSNVILIVPVLKEAKMDFILQKATELGAYAIYPFKSERSVVKTDGKDDKKIERWRKIVKEASEQSKRVTIPKIPKIFSLQELKDLDGNKIFCSTTEKEKNVKKYLTKHKKYDKLNIVVGPEGGLSKKEEAFLIDNGFVPVSLGPFIMRVETVPIFILSIISYESME